MKMINRKSGTRRVWEAIRNAFAFKKLSGEDQLLSRYLVVDERFELAISERPIADGGNPLSRV